MANEMTPHPRFIDWQKKHPRAVGVSEFICSEHPPLDGAASVIQDILSDEGAAKELTYERLLDKLCDHAIAALFFPVNRHLNALIERLEGNENMLFPPNGMDPAALHGFLIKAMARVEQFEADLCRIEEMWQAAGTPTGQD